MQLAKNELTEENYHEVTRERERRELEHLQTLYPVTVSTRPNKAGRKEFVIDEGLQKYRFSTSQGLRQTVNRINRDRMGRSNRPFEMNYHHLGKIVEQLGGYSP